MARFVTTGKLSESVLEDICFVGISIVQNCNIVFMGQINERLRLFFVAEALWYIVVAWEQSLGEIILG